MESTDRVSTVTSAGAFRQPGGRHPKDRPAPERQQSRALTVVAPPAEVLQARPVSRNGGFAPFLAHLVATRDKAPQQRQRRRAEPSAAAACYAASSRGAPVEPKPRFNRSA